MSETPQSPSATQDQGTGPPDLEQLPVTRGERVAAVLGLVVLAALALVCIDLATGGKLSSRIGGVPASSTTEGDGADPPCADC
jgi:hypothetical protein